MKKKMMMVLLSMVLGIGLMACGSESGSTAEGSEGTDVADETTGEAVKSVADLKIGVIVRDGGGEFWKYAITGANDAGRDLGCSVDVVGPQSQTSYEEQNNMIENFLTSGKYDAVVIGPLQPDSVDKVIGEPSIPVILVSTDVEFPALTSTISVDNVTGAYEGAKYALDLLGDEIGNVVLLNGTPGEPNGILRQDGFEKALTEAGIQPAASQSADYLADKAASVMENMLTELKNEVSLVLCANDEMAAGAAMALDQAGVEAYIVGYDGVQFGVQSIIDGNIDCTIAQSPYMFGYQGVEDAVKAALGEELERHVQLQTTIITSENAEEFMETLKTQSGN